MPVYQSVFMKVITYTIGCYTDAPGGYIWSVPIRASRAWVQGVLKKDGDIVGTKLTRRQFEILRCRVPRHVEVSCHSRFGYFLEANTADDEAAAK
jgi:hypothetical protein